MCAMTTYILLLVSVLSPVIPYVGFCWQNRRLPVHTYVESIAECHRRSSSMYDSPVFVLSHVRRRGDVADKRSQIRRRQPAVRKCQQHVVELRTSQSRASGSLCATLCRQHVHCCAQALAGLSGMLARCKCCFNMAGQDFLRLEMTILARCRDFHDRHAKRHTTEASWTHPASTRIALRIGSAVRRLYM
jgi:hypothetical protein